MSNEGGLLETLFERFPAENPRPLLSSIFWLGAIGGLVFTGFVVVSAFMVDAKAGFIAFFVNGVGLFLWLAMLRVMLEASGALFDIRDEAGGIGDLQASLTEINETLKPVNDQGEKGRRRPTPPKSAAPTDRRPGLPTPDGPDAVLEIIANEMEGGGDVASKDLCRGWNVSEAEISEALSQLQAEGVVVRVRFGVYRWLDDAAAESASASGFTSSDSDMTRQREPQDDTRVVQRAAVVPDSTPSNVCSRCGTEGRPDQRFCSKCGNQLL